LYGAVDGNQEVSRRLVRPGSQPRVVMVVAPSRRG
jgi:hypothetical protein